ncbi:hypothetical protein [Nocardioides sp.]|uniref:hypothetical protein n=1 Tax=Nocardioides sp. TaxID=35761 RepID=UPI002735A7F2|nr:hypothetical protein [Nocardioides sp.]MDP3891406.1 hypothetical protein [Nocardioides sp.]
MTAPAPSPDRSGPALFLVLLVMVALIVVAWGVNHPQAPETPSPAPAQAAPPDPILPTEPPSEPPSESPSQLPVEPGPSTEPTDVPPPASGVDATLPGGRYRVFAGNHFLVAYYGTAGTGALGVLGETSPDVMQRRVTRAARPFARPGQPLQVVYELIVTIADRGPGPDGDFSHDIDRDAVRRYIAAAERHDALLLLDIQPGRSDFLDAAKRWEWALRHPNVGLALDPEWRMGRREVPGTVIGSVGAAEVNRVSAWLSELAVAHDLPEKLFVLHQFRTAMIDNIDRIRQRPRLALVQHVDGFGTRAQKRATYGVVARPQQFTMGFKLFYDEDVNRMGPREVHRLRPPVRFISFQ